MTERSYSRALAVVRLVAVYAGVLLLLYLSEPTPAGVSIGFVIAALGEAVRMWAAGHLLKTRELVTSGPYRYTRNPLYLGRLLILTGLCVMARLPYGLNWVVLGVGYAGFFGYYLPRKEKVEPERLREWHGEAFERYHRAVPALLPTLRPYRGGRATGWSSERMIHNREYLMVLGIVLAAGYLLWKAYAMRV